METDTADPPVEWSGRQSATLVGISYRQLDYWQRCCGFTTATAPAGSGSRRVLSSDDVARLDTIARILRTGLFANQVQRAVSVVNDQWTDPAPDEVTVDLRAPGVEPLRVTVRSIDDIVDGAAQRFVAHAAVRSASAADDGWAGWQ